MASYDLGDLASPAADDKQAAKPAAKYDLGGLATMGSPPEVHDPTEGMTWGEKFLAGAGKGVVDVVVTEGFAGNIALKAAEGTARQLVSYLRSAMSRTWAAQLGYLLARQAFNMLREKMDPRKSNGGVFLGLNGIVIKSHGGADAEGTASAIDMGYDMVRYELLAKIGQSMAGEVHAATVRMASGA